MAKSKNRQKHLSGNPLKRQETQQNKEAQKEKKPIPAVPIIIGVVALIIIIAVSILVYNHFHTEDLLAKRYYIDEKADIAVMTLPSSLFAEGANLEESAETLLNSGGVSKVVVNDDNSITAIMTIERYEKFKTDLTNAVEAMPLMLISDRSAIRNYVPEKDHTVLNITVNPDVETIENEINDALYMARFYQMCMMKDVKSITINYIKEGTTDVYLTEVYDLNGKLLSTKNPQLTAE